MKIWTRTSLVLFLFVAAWGARIQVIREQRQAGRLRSLDSPNTFFGAFMFGGFRPVFLEHLWSKADELYGEGRYWEAMDVFDRITRLDPGNARIWYHQVRTMVYDIGQNEIDPGERWRWYKRALARLDQGLRRHPDSWALQELRFWICYRNISTDPPVNRRCRRASGRDGLEWSVDVAGRLHRDFSDRQDAWLFLLATGEDVTQRLVNRNQPGSAAKALVELQSLVSDFTAHFPETGWLPADLERLSTWQEILETLDGACNWSDAGVPRVIDEGLLERAALALEDRASHLEELRVNSEEVTFDGELLSVIHVKFMELCQSALIAKSSEGTLRMLGHVNTICRLTEGRIGPQRPYYSKTYVSLFENFVEIDRELLKASTNEAGAGRSLRARWSEALDALDRELRSRSGNRTDGFGGRIRKARESGR